MSKHIGFIKRCAVFTALLSVCFLFVWKLVTPKFFMDNDWPTTSAYCGFYEMKEESVDVLFFGSSHAASFFIPQELYNDYGYTSYNLGCEQQNLVVSYFWLKEALRSQNPKTVVLDCYMLFTYNAKEPLNTSEACTRKALDYMKWSPVKMEAVKTICELDQNQSLLSYYLPNIRYHTRWKGLGANDFKVWERKKHYELKGYAPLAGYCGIEEFLPFDGRKAENSAVMVPLMEEYLEKIRLLCEQQGIELLLVKNPATVQSAEKYQTVQDYAKRHGLQYFDFNEKGLYKKTGYSFASDNHDGGHGNFWGARKITKYIGSVLKQGGRLQKKTEAQWEETKDYYMQMIKDCELPHITELNTYLAAVNNEYYSVFLATKGDWTAYLGNESAVLLRNLGLRAPESGAAAKAGFLAAVSDGKIHEQSGLEQLQLSGTVRRGIVTFLMESTAPAYGDRCSIAVDGTEYSKNSRGLNVVVLQRETGRVIDTVCFDTGAEGRPAIR